MKASNRPATSRHHHLILGTRSALQTRGPTHLQWPRRQANAAPCTTSTRRAEIYIWCTAMAPLPTRRRHSRAAESHIQPQQGIHPYRSFASFTCLATSDLARTSSSTSKHSRPACSGLAGSFGSTFMASVEVLATHSATQGPLSSRSAEHCASHSHLRYVFYPGSEYTL